MNKTQTQSKTKSKALPKKYSILFNTEYICSLFLPVYICPHFFFAYILHFSMIDLRLKAESTAISFIAFLTMERFSQDVS